VLILSSIAGQGAECSAMLAHVVKGVLLDLAGCSRCKGLSD